MKVVSLLLVIVAPGILIAQTLPTANSTPGLGYAHVGEYQASNSLQSVAGLPDIVRLQDSINNSSSENTVTARIVGARITGVSLLIAGVGNILVTIGTVSNLSDIFDFDYTNGDATIDTIADIGIGASIAAAAGILVGGSIIMVNDVIQFFSGDQIADNVIPKNVGDDLITTGIWTGLVGGIGIGFVGTITGLLIAIQNPSLGGNLTAASSAIGGASVSVGAILIGSGLLLSDRGRVTF
ncbi:MAG: hypothetical protein ACR2PY_05945 [Salinispira sp.]